MQLVLEIVLQVSWLLRIFYKFVWKVQIDLLYAENLHLQSVSFFNEIVYVLLVDNGFFLQSL